MRYELDYCAGNKETLLVIPRQRNQDPRDELLKFHKKYYSSNIMALAVLGKGVYLCVCVYMLNQSVPASTQLNYAAV
jgi:hypothetical protein